MRSALSFNHVLESAEVLSADEQETLVDVLHRRLVERRQSELARDVRKSRQDFSKGRCRAATPREIMKEILS